MIKVRLIGNLKFLFLLFINILLGLFLFSGCLQKKYAKAPRCKAPAARAKNSQNGATMTYCDSFIGAGPLTGTGPWVEMPH